MGPARAGPGGDGGRLAAIRCHWAMDSCHALMDLNFSSAAPAACLARHNAAMAFQTTALLNLCPACPCGCSELGGVYDSCNLFMGLGRRERKSQVGCHRSTCLARLVAWLWLLRPALLRGAALWHSSLPQCLQRAFHACLVACLHASRCSTPGAACCGRCSTTTCSWASCTACAAWSQWW